MNVLGKPILADLHTHTVASKHALSTVKENIDCAVEQGLEYLAITDHFDGLGTNILGTDIEVKNEIARVLDLGKRLRSQNKIKVISGIELNIGQQSRWIKKLSGASLKIMGLHNWYLNLENKSPLLLANTLKHSIEDNIMIDGIAHPERGLRHIEAGKHEEGFDSEIQQYLDWLIDYTKNNNIYLEVNEGSLMGADKSWNETAMTYWLKLAKQNGNKIALASDAHYCSEVGKFTGVIGILEGVGFNPNLIVNCNREDLERLYNK